MDFVVHSDIQHKQVGWGPSPLKTATERREDRLSHKQHISHADCMLKFSLNCISISKVLTHLDITHNQLHSHNPL